MRVMLGIIMGREHSAEQGQEVVQVLFYLLLLYLFSFVSSKTPGLAQPEKVGMHGRDTPRKRQKPPQ